ncbi:MAG: alpha/beta hydrolase fold domain-containing protein [Actinomycetota bacterium]|nr:alpha/beta hydrolase fold domain-containing protein [Actinomycetota bacterium]
MDITLSQLTDEGSSAYVEESRAFNAAVQATASHPHPDPSTPEGLQAARSQLRSRPPDPRAAEFVARAEGREVPVRVIIPQRGQVRGAYLQIHGGGFYMDAASRSDSRNGLLADAAGVAVVSVDYRLAPEHPWPAAPDDCETAALWLVERAQDLFGTARLTIGGASAGANLAAATLLRLRDRGQLQRFVGAVLEFGAYDLSGQSPSGRAYADEWFIQAYAGHVADRTNPDISPLYGDLRGLPGVLVVVGALDMLLEDSLTMASRLVAAGNEVDLRVYPESRHGFTSSPTKMAAAALRGISSWLATKLDGR